MLRRRRRPARSRPRNDPGQYDDLAGEWWRPGGVFAPLHWLASSRAGLLPPPPRPEAVLVDLGCGGGLLAPYVRGYLHVGVDVTASALRVAAGQGVTPVQADVARLPLADGCADVVVAGELFEHVGELEACVAEIARVLRPGGLLVFDMVPATRFARVVLVTIAERVPGGAPPGLHDPALFVDPARLRRLAAAHSIELQQWGLWARVGDVMAFLARRRRPVRLVRTRSTALLCQGVGRKVAPSSIQ